MSYRPAETTDNLTFPHRRVQPKSERGIFHLKFGPRRSAATRRNDGLEFALAVLLELKGRVLAGPCAAMSAVNRPSQHYGRPLALGSCLWASASDARIFDAGG